ncbi:DUF1508 domain-containing protein [Methylomonas sp. MED-D]|uniref:DUF1508 domain-containing protein n=1 Tax=Methylomonas koyamae TaxID=702114 RepID=A0A177NHY5_9GAMM|nr:MULTISPECIES: DUF1508 domain-containing protein [Methylomonas]NJA07304.1 DUF1508 domain-containing protein [Methylococcaceae bacterium WWC4]MDT4332644.1 DUF1508 domain-containing protein [Methylomonas sp. MV1]OAI17587.1 hypothetical protein A1355_07320 [Methylomonas koyamae]OHX34554.1 DUF1508 domain-containing protein [Methylomonas sp. LWB]WGS85197.1 DUF1508 domain-containing protein [Methylomonas sp. UP202]
MPATFELKTNEDNQYVFNFLSSKGELILMSGDYPNKEEAIQGIKEVRTGSLMSHQIAASRVPEGDTFFVIKDTVGNIIVKSVLYNSNMLFDNALHTVKDNACIAEIVDLTA